MKKISNRTTNHPKSVKEEKILQSLLPRKMQNNQIKEKQNMMKVTKKTPYQRRKTEMNRKKSPRKNLP